jgi:hypothetical protein
MILGKAHHYGETINFKFDKFIMKEEVFSNRNPTDSKVG